MHNSMMLFTFFHFRLEIIPFLGKFGSKNQINQFKLKFGNYIDSNMQNSLVMFTFSVCDRKYPFWVNLVQKVKINSLSWNMVPTLIRIRRIQWRCSLYAEFNHAVHFFFDWKYPFWANLVQKIKIISLSLNLVPTLIRICRIQW